MLALLAALFPTSYFYNAAFALLQRRVGEDEEPTRRPLRRPPVGASKHESVCIETCFKDTAMDVNHA